MNRKEQEMTPLQKAIEALLNNAVASHGAYWKEFSDGVDAALEIIRQHESQQAVDDSGESMEGRTAALPEDAGE